MSEMTPTERSALVTYRLTLGDKLTLRDVSRMTGIKVRSARKMLYTQSRVIPIVEEDGKFYLLGTTASKEDGWTTL